MTHIQSDDESHDQNELDDIENQIEENEEIKILDKKVAQRKDEISAIRYDSYNIYSERMTHYDS